MKIPGVTKTPGIFLFLFSSGFIFFAALGAQDPGQAAEHDQTGANQAQYGRYRGITRCWGVCSHSADDAAAAVNALKSS